MTPNEVNKFLLKPQDRRFLTRDFETVFLSRLDAIPDIYQKVTFTQSFEELDDKRYYVVIDCSLLTESEFQNQIAQEIMISFAISSLVLLQYSVTPERVLTLFLPGVE